MEMEMEITSISIWERGHVMMPFLVHVVAKGEKDSHGWKKKGRYEFCPV
jgi:hypothetical protein